MSTQPRPGETIHLVKDSQCYFPFLTTDHKVAGSIPALPRILKCGLGLERCPPSPSNYVSGIVPHVRKRGGRKQLDPKVKHSKRLRFVFRLPCTSPLNARTLTEPSIEIIYINSELETELTSCSRITSSPSRGAIFTNCSHTFVFWLRKTSVSVETYQLSVRVFICASHCEISFFFG